MSAFNVTAPILVTTLHPTPTFFLSKTIALLKLSMLENLYDGLIEHVTQIQTFSAATILGGKVPHLQQQRYIS